VTKLSAHFLGLGLTLPSPAAGGFYIGQTGRSLCTVM